MTTNITLAGGTVTATGNEPSRLFRNAWFLDQGAVSIDLSAAKQIAHVTRSAWFAWKRHAASNPVVHGGKSFWSDAAAGQLVDGECGFARDEEDGAPGSYAGTAWKAMDGTFLAVPDFSAIKALKKAYRDHYNGAFVASEGKSAEIEAAVDATALETVVTGMLDDIG